MPCWTTHELRRLVEMHRERRPAVKEMVAAFPRHSQRGIETQAQTLHLRPKINRWLAVAHLHFERREAG